MGSNKLVLRIYTQNVLIYVSSSFYCNEPYVYAFLYRIQYFFTMNGLISLKTASYWNEKKPRNCNIKEVHCVSAKIINRSYFCDFNSPVLVTLENLSYGHRLSLTWRCLIIHPWPYILLPLKLYCTYGYTRPYMINRIWILKQLWLQVNGHAWFHLHWLRWPVRNGEGAKIQNENICFQRDSNPHYASPRQESQYLRPLGHSG